MLIMHRLSMDAVQQVTSAGEMEMKKEIEIEMNEGNQNCCATGGPGAARRASSRNEPPVDS